MECPKIWNIIKNSTELWNILKLIVVTSYLDIQMVYLLEEVQNIFRGKKYLWKTIVTKVYEEKK